MYLEGISFTIVTDCNSFTLTLEKRLINPRIARWALELENYDYRVRHRRGELMAHVDALSRMPPVASIEQCDIHKNIQITQARDNRIRDIRDRLEMGHVDGIHLENGLVFRCGLQGQK